MLAIGMADCYLLYKDTKKTIKISLLITYKKTPLHETKQSPIYTGKL